MKTETQQKSPLTSARGDDVVRNTRAQPGHARTVCSCFRICGCNGNALQKDAAFPRSVFRRCRAYCISKAKTWSRTSTVVVALLQLLSREQWTARERTSAHVAILGGHVQVLRVLGDETRLEDADEDVAEALACLEGAVWVAHLWRGVPLEH